MVKTVNIQKRDNSYSGQDEAYSEIISSKAKSECFSLYLLSKLSKILHDSHEILQVQYKKRMM